MAKLEQHYVTARLMPVVPIARRHLFALAAAAGVGWPLSRRTLATSSESFSRSASPTLSQRGVNYGVNSLLWTDAVMRRELRAIRDELGCNAVLLQGSSAHRLIATAEAALELGLITWVQPRLMNWPQADVLSNLRDVAAAVERLRGGTAVVGINVGVEFSLFTDGIIPGGSFEERAVHLVSNLDRLEEFNAQLNALLDRTADAASAFGGPTTYSSGSWETVDWSRFSHAGFDLYRDVHNTGTYAADLRRLVAAAGKPALVTEFGCCCFEGAEDLGGSGWEVVDYSTDPPRILDNRIRSETVQADEIMALLDIFEAEQVDGTFVYQFVDHGLLHSDDPSLDLDMANFAIVKTFAPGMGTPEDRTYWEPKEAFYRLAKRWRTTG